MLSKTTEEALALMILKENPACDRDYALKLASAIHENMDARLDEHLAEYAATGRMRELEHGEFTLLMIRAMHFGCSYLEACMLMDEYMRDPLGGKARILMR